MPVNIVLKLPNRCLTVELYRCSSRSMPTSTVINRRSKVMYFGTQHEQRGIGYAPAADRLQTLQPGGFLVALRRFTATICVT